MCDYNRDALALMLDRVVFLAEDKAHLQAQMEESANRLLEKAIPLLVAALKDPRNRIAQIRALRELTGCDLRTAKEAAEKAWAEADMSFQPKASAPSSNGGKLYCEAEDAEEQ